MIWSITFPFLLTCSHLLLTVTASTQESRHEMFPLRSARMEQSQPFGSNEAHEFAARRLNSHETVSEFCSDLEPIEDFLKSRMLSFFFVNSTYLISLLTENESYNCACDYDENTVGLSCSTMYSYFDDPFIPFSISDRMSFSFNQDMEAFMPVAADWCEISYTDYEYCESYQFNATDPMRLTSCSIRDDYCTTGSYTCEICPGGQTVGFFHVGVGECWQPVTCEDEYQGAFLVDYHLETPLNTMVPFEVIDEECSSNRKIPSIEEFCFNQLATVESTLTEKLMADSPHLEDVSGYQCECVYDSSTTITDLMLDCNTTYVWPNVTSEPRVSREAMKLSSHPENPNLLVPSMLEWCDIDMNITTTDGGLSDMYCDKYYFDTDGQELLSCDIGGCTIGFCELCSDGLTIGHSCFEFANTCLNDGSDEYLGAYMFAFSDVQMVVDKCELPPTFSPMPTLAPTAEPGPTTSIAPSVMPTAVADRDPSQINDGDGAMSQCSTLVSTVVGLVVLGLTVFC